MGLDATLVLTTLVTATALTPVSAPLFAYAFIGPALTLSPLALGIKLFAILSGSLVVAVIIRRFAGLAAIRRYNEQIDGMNILLVFFFVAAVMENVASRFWADPLAMIELTALAFAVTFCRAGIDRTGVCRGGTRARFRARPDGLAAQYGIDAGGDRRRAA